MGRSVNKTLFVELVKNHGKNAVEKVVVESGVAQTIIREAMRGNAPKSSASMIELAKYFQTELNVLFPKICKSEEAA